MAIASYALANTLSPRLFPVGLSIRRDLEDLRSLGTDQAYQQGTVLKSWSPESQLLAPNWWLLPCDLSCGLGSIWYTSSSVSSLNPNVLEGE